MQYFKSSDFSYFENTNEVNISSVISLFEQAEKYGESETQTHPILISKHGHEVSIYLVSYFYGSLGIHYPAGRQCGCGHKCYGKRVCGSECRVLDSLKICDCSGPCTDSEIKYLMEAGYTKHEAEKKMAEG